MQKTGSLYSHSRHSSALSAQGPSVNAPKQQNLNSDGSFRASSPASKTKIRLVSPMREKGSAHHPQPKENHPPLSATTPNFYTRNSASIELGGRPSLKEPHHAASQNFHAQPASKAANIVVLPPPEPLFKKTSQFLVAQPVLRAQSPARVLSPPKICINNKCFDLGAIRSQVVYVTPLHQRRPFSPPAPYFSRSAEGFTQGTWPSELVIQEENAMEQLKESYESELKEIKSLQQEIEENNVQIRELLKSSRVSRELNTSRLESTPLNSSEENFAAELLAENPLVQSADLQPSSEACSKLNSLMQHCDEASVQTEGVQSGERAVDRNEIRCSKFAISRSKECQIQLICSGSKQKEAVQLKTLAKEEVESQLELPAYAVNVNLKSSRADSQASAIKYSQQEIQFKEQEEIATPRLGSETVKSADDVASLIKASRAQTAVKKDIEIKAQIQKGESGVEGKAVVLGQEEMLSSSISSGKRRINNSIYL